MNKSTLVNVLCDKMNVPKRRAKEAVDLIFDSMIEALLKEERIEIRGLGSFSVRHYQAYTGRNPRTGESIQVKPKRLPFFKTGKELKEFVDHEEDENAAPEIQQTGGQ